MDEMEYDTSRQRLLEIILFNPVKK